MSTAADNPAAPAPCAPCRGTGEVVSHLGGSPSLVRCPWCEGTGTMIAGHNAQQARERPGEGTDGDGGPAAA
jgi:DnaJ-class molecular chaperone